MSNRRAMKILTNRTTRQTPTRLRHPSSSTINLLSPKQLHKCPTTSSLDKSEVTFEKSLGRKI